MKHRCSQTQLKAPGLDPEVLTVVGLLRRRVYTCTHECNHCSKAIKQYSEDHCTFMHFTHVISQFKNCLPRGFPVNSDCRNALNTSEEQIR